MPILDVNGMPMNTKLPSGVVFICATSPCLSWSISNESILFS